MTSFYEYVCIFLMLNRFIGKSNPSPNIIFKQLAWVDVEVVESWILDTLNNYGTQLYKNFRDIN